RTVNLQNHHNSLPYCADVAKRSIGIVCIAMQTIPNWLALAYVSQILRVARDGGARGSGTALGTKRTLAAHVRVGSISRHVPLVDIIARCGQYVQALAMIAWPPSPTASPSADAAAIQKIPNRPHTTSAQYERESWWLRCR